MLYSISIFNFRNGDSVKLKATGERMVIGSYQDSIENYLIYKAHIATYEYIASFAEDKVVLDLGCGSGYGSNYLADYAKNLEAVDVAKEAIDYASHSFIKDNLSFTQINPDKQYPFESSTFDLIVSSQVIEHVENMDLYLSEIKRLLKPGGKVIIVTPDRVHRLYKWQKPWNEFHLFEFDAFSLNELLSSYLQIDHMYKMGSVDSLLDHEINRTKKMRLLSLPFTLPFIPDFLRVFCLNYIKRIKRVMKESKTGSESKVFPEIEFDINNEVQRSINLVVIARR